MLSSGESHLRTNRLQQPEQALDNFLTALEERTPLATAATLQSAMSR